MRRSPRRSSERSSAFLLSYGFVESARRRAIEARQRAEDDYMSCIRTALLAFARGDAPMTCVEFARRNIEPVDRPTFAELEALTRRRRRNVAKQGRQADRSSSSRRRSNGHGGHHGGAWKVAYADFVTAMMAFFMVMWILGMDQNVRNAIEGYFSNPVGYKKGYTRARVRSRQARRRRW